LENKFELVKKEVAKANSLGVFRIRCAPCIKLDKSIWQSTEFKEYAASNLILERADFLRKTKPIRSDLQKQNEGLAARYNKEGFSISSRFGF
jgi:hypothetical protein